MSSDKKTLVLGVFWTALGKYSGLILGMVVTMVLARVLGPSEFGTVTLANVFISFLTILSSLGIAPAIIQRRDLTSQDLDSIFSFTCFVGFCFAALFFLSSWSIASFYDNNQLIPVCQVLSVSLFFSTINMVPNALMSKHLRFKESAVRTFLIHVIVTPIAIVAALKGAGIYSLLISPIVSSVGIFIYNHHFYPVKIAWKIRTDSLRKILSYSIYQFFFQITNFLTSNIDKLLLGKALGSRDLGYYQMSNQLIQIPAGNITGVVYPVLHPIFTKYQDDKQTLMSKYETMIKLIASCVFPLSVVLFCCANELIYLIYGPNWGAAIPAFKIMSIALPALIILPVTGTFFQSSGEIRTLFKIGLINSFVAISSISIACFVYNSLQAVAWAIVIFNYSSLIVTYYYMYVKILNRSLFRFFTICLGPLCFTVCLGGVLLIINTLLGDNLFVDLLVKGLVSLSLLAIYLQLTKQFDVLSMMRRVIGRIKR